MVYLDLSEIDTVFRGRWFWGTHAGALVRFRRRDYLGPSELPLDVVVRDRVEREAGVRPDGPIRLLTHLAFFGHCFNPVSLYYCFDRSGDHLDFVLAEITNTPWSDRHTYLLRAGGDPALVRDRSAKTFHVSPFMPMNLSYDWRLTAPARTLVAHIEVSDDARKIFDATLTLRRREIRGAELTRALVRFPAMTARVVLAIYWHALRLWLKGATFHPHPTLTSRT
jgi:DUF1365 family protein